MIDTLKSTATGFATATVVDNATHNELSLVALALISASTQIILKMIEKRNDKRAKV